jgi:hypothetical protein
MAVETRLFSILLFNVIPYPWRINTHPSTCDDLSFPCTIHVLSATLRALST